MDEGKELIARLLKQSPEGPRLEIGVHRGSTLKLIANHGGVTIGVDSFCGMPEPGEHDGTQYPKGKLAVPEAYVAASCPNAQLIRGFVPDILGNVPDGPYAFVHLDIDHYLTTKAALEWIFPRMLPSGILCCDDWFPGKTSLAAKALAEVERPMSGQSGRKCWWVL